MLYFCTYFDSNYLANGLCLNESLQKYLGNNYHLFILCLDDKTVDVFNQVNKKNITIIKLGQLEQHNPELLIAKSNRKFYEYYFTLTPHLPLYLIEKYNHIDIITYVDADIYFYKSPEILINHLEKSSTLIIPHFFSDANLHLNNYGKYNVVFNSFKNDIYGVSCLKWWGQQCINWCYDYVDGDKFADQKYLDQFESKFKGVKVCTNRGANLAIFNIDNSTLTLKKGVVFVNNDELIFYHFHKLRKLNRHLYNANFLTPKDYQNKILQSIYTKYIRRIQYYERRYNLIPNQTNRYENKYIYGLGIIEYTLKEPAFYVTQIYSVVINLTNINRIVKRISKRLKKIALSI